MSNVEFKKKVDDLIEIFTLVKEMQEGKPGEEINEKWLLATNEHRSVDLWCRTYVVTHLITLSLMRDNFHLSLDVWKNFGLDMVGSLKTHGERSPLFNHSKEGKETFWTYFVTQVLNSLDKTPHHLLIDVLLNNSISFCYNLCGFKTAMLPDHIEHFVKMHEHGGTLESHYGHYKAPGQHPYGAGGCNPNYGYGDNNYVPPRSGHGFTPTPPFYNPNTRFNPNVSYPHHGDYAGMVKTVQHLQTSLCNLENVIAVLRQKVD